MYLDFNPRSYERSDPSPSDGCDYIHYFNPRSYERSDILVEVAPPKSYTFQSTLLREERQALHSVGRGSCLFQSTLLREERLLHVQMLLKMERFQSTLLREERLLFSSFDYTKRDFNPRSYERSDFRDDITCQSIVDFNPRSYERSDDPFT